MATELFPSSFRCDCGEELDFFEGTVREMKKMSKNKEVRLGEGNTLFYIVKVKQEKYFARH